jgi:hypothetical protein
VRKLRRVIVVMVIVSGVAVRNRRPDGIPRYQSMPQWVDRSLPSRHSMTVALTAAWPQLFRSAQGEIRYLPCGECMFRTAIVERLKCSPNV